MAEFVKEHPDIQFTPPRWRPFFLLHDLPEEGLTMKEFIIRKFGEEKVCTKKFYSFILTQFLYNSWTSLASISPATFDTNYCHLLPSTLTGN